MGFEAPEQYPMLVILHCEKTLYRAAHEENNWDRTWMKAQVHWPLHLRLFAGPVSPGSGYSHRNAQATLHQAQAEVG